MNDNDPRGGAEPIVGAEPPPTAPLPRLPLRSVLTLAGVALATFVIAWAADVSGHP